MFEQLPEIRRESGKPEIDVPEQNPGPTLIETSPKNHPEISGFDQEVGFKVV